MTTVNPQSVVVKAIDERFAVLSRSKGHKNTKEMPYSFVDAIAGKRITYAQLTKGKTWFDADSLS